MSTNELTLARDLVFNEVMALRYIDVLVAGPSPFEEPSTASDDLRLEEWAAARGHAIARSRMPEAFDLLPKRMLDYWAGTYLLMAARPDKPANGKPKAAVSTLMIDVRGGVSLDGVELTDVRFNEGTLTWAATSQRPAARFAFDELTPPEFGFFQKRCRGELSDGAGTPQEVVGTTVAIAAVTSNASASVPFDVSSWAGTYTIAAGGFLTVGKGLDDGHVAVVYQGDDFSVDALQQPLPSSAQALSWDSGSTRYQLFFAKLGSGFNTVAGRVYSAGGPVPEDPTFFATDEGWVNRLSPSAIATLTVASVTGGVAALAGVVALVLNVLSRRDANLNQKRKLYASEVNRQVEPEVLQRLEEEIQEARDLLSEASARFNIEAKNMAKFEPTLAVLIRDPDAAAHAARVTNQLKIEHAALALANQELATSNQRLADMRTTLATEQATVDRLRKELPNRRDDPPAAKIELDQRRWELERMQEVHARLIEEARMRANDVLARTERVNTIAREINHGPT